MEKSSSHTQPIKYNSESHNLRKKKLDYVNENDTHKNQSIILEEIKPTLARIKKVIKEKTGRTMQKKAAPIRESVVLLGKKNTMKDLEKMCDNLHEQLGIKMMQIHIHDDEGHTTKAGDWKQNRHAHIVFNWVNEETGRSLKLNRIDMSDMQTIVADSLNLERGVSSSKKHLNSIQFKAEAERKKTLEMQKDASKAKEELKYTKVKHKGENISHELVKGVSETFKRLGGGNEAQRLKKLLEAQKMEHSKTILSKSEMYTNLYRHYKESQKKLENSMPKEKYQEIEKKLERLKEVLENTKSNLKESNEINENNLEALKRITLGGDKDLFEEWKNWFEKQQNKNRGISY